MKHTGSKIETWFDEFQDSGEFCANLRALPYSIIGPLHTSTHLLFTTKPNAVLSALFGGEIWDETGVIGRYGLPAQSDLKWIRSLIGRRRLLFLGDLDPADLMVYAWLRVRLPTKNPSHIGLNDSLMKSLRLSLHPIPLTTVEQASLHVLEDVFPDYRKIIGMKCASILMNGSKYELDAIGSLDKSSLRGFRSILSRDI